MTTKTNESKINDLIKSLEKNTVKNPTSEKQATLEQWDKFSAILDQLTNAMLASPAQN